MRRLLVFLLLCLFPLQALAAGTITYKSGVVSGTIIGLLTTANIPKADILQSSLSCPDLGSTDTYTCSLSPAITAYVTGTHYRFKANTVNTGAATINLNSLGAITIVKAPGGVTTALATNDIRAGQWVDLVYDGTNMQMQSTLGNAVTGTGDVVGPNSSVDNGIVRYDGATGKLVQGYTSNTPTCDDAGLCTFPAGVITGSGSGVAGRVELLEGTASALVANAVSIYAPVDVAAGGIAFVSPATAATGIPLYTNSSGVMTESIVAPEASGNVMASNGSTWASSAPITPSGATVATSETTTSTSYTDLATSGPAVTVTIGASGKALVMISSYLRNSAYGSAALAGFAVSGASTIAASDTTALISSLDDDFRFGASTLVTGLAAGSTTFTMKYRVGASTGTFLDRHIVVTPY